MNNLTQKSRFISIKTTLKGDDDLLLLSFKGSEHISDLFEFQLEVISENPYINPADIIGKPVTVTIHDDSERQFYGFINNITQCESTVTQYSSADIKLSKYKMTMVPWLWFLTQNNNYRIFQEQTSQQIITQLFKEAGFIDFDYKPLDTNKPREYCVQYNESDFNFISRLLEEDGIAYYFEHIDGKHTLHIVEEAITFKNITNPDINYSNQNNEKSQIIHWQHSYQFRKGSWSTNDYNIKQPKKSKWHTKPTLGSVLNPKKTNEKTVFSNVNNYGHASFEPYYDFSGLENLSLIRIEAEEASINKVEAKSNCSRFYAGGVFNLIKHTEIENGSYLITTVEHHAEENSYFPNSKNTTSYTNEFKCIPSNVRYRPSLVHPKPVMSGPQSAVVIDRTDPEKMDRIKVRFPWNADYQTCWIPVMQVWASNKWGTSFVPHLDMEVVVDFYNGDVDRPLIMGAVYNGENKSPYENKHQSGVLTPSSNELLFDDTPGSEKICIKGVKDLNIDVKNNYYQKIENNLNIDVKNDFTQNIEKNFNINIVGDCKETITGTTTKESKGSVSEYFKVDKDTYTEGSTSELYVGKTDSTYIGSKNELFVGAKSSTFAGGQLSVTLGLAATVNKTKELMKSKKTEHKASVLYSVEGPKIIFKAGDTVVTITDGLVDIMSKKVKIKGNVTIDGDLNVMGYMHSLKDLDSKNFTS